MSMQTLPSKEDFIVWVMNVPDSDRFLVEDYEYCPLARWLHDTLPTHPAKVHVGGNAPNEVDLYFVGQPSRHIPLDAWMVEFYKAFDRHYGYMSAVTAFQLKADILNQVL